MAKSSILCATPRCIGDIEKYGDHYHSVHDRADHAQCEWCGGKTEDGGQTWAHDCVKCGVSVAPGDLLGLFVPHRCKECDAKIIAKDRAEGRMCRRCGTVFSYCCC